MVVYIVISIVALVVALVVAFVAFSGVKFLWVHKPPDSEGDSEGDSAFLVRSRSRDCKKGDLPEDIRGVLDQGVGGVLSNDQMVVLLRASGSEEDADAVAAEGKQERTHKDMDSLTAFELEFVKRDECPDCEHNKFLAGPRGGLAQNFKCANPNCGSRFNNMGPFGVDRISDASPDRKLMS